MLVSFVYLRKKGVGSGVGSISICSFSYPAGGSHKRHHPPPSLPSHPPKEYTPVYNNSGFEIPPRMLSTL